MFNIYTAGIGKKVRVRQKVDEIRGETLIRIARIEDGLVAEWRIYTDVDEIQEAEQGE